MTVREKSTLKSLHSKWALGTATKAQVMRCMELEQKARAAALLVREIGQLHLQALA